MTGDEFYKYHWKAMEVVEVVWESRTQKKIIQCSILEINFEAHTMRLVPVADIGYEEKEFWCSVKLINKIIKNQKLTLTR